MKIAVTYDNGSVFQHVGHTEEFKVYTVEDVKVVSAQVVSSDGQGHGALAGLLSHNGIDALICGGIGMGAKNALESFGIKLYAGVSGDADEAGYALPSGTPFYPEGANSSHHDHEEGHQCAHHSHEGHSCSCHC